MRADVLLARDPGTLYALSPNPAVTHSSVSRTHLHSCGVRNLFGAPVAACCIGFIVVGDVYCWCLLAFAIILERTSIGVFV
jgi:hypothetical protein